MGKSKNPDNLFQRPKSDIWYIRYSVNGCKKIKSLRTTSVCEAKRQRDMILGQRSLSALLGIEVPEPKKEPTFAEIVEKWHQARRASDLRESTLRQSEGTVNLWLVPFFGDKRMASITADDVERFIVHLRYAKCHTPGRQDQHLARDTIFNIFRFLPSIYRMAAKRRWYTGPNPVMQLDRTPTRGPGRNVSLTEDEARRLLDALIGVLRYKVALALATGLRWGEVHGLEWERDIDLNAPSLTVNRSFRGPPKTEASCATLPLNADITAMLRRWRREQGIGARCVFPNRAGEIPLKQATSDGENIASAAKRAGIDKHITPHVFRHSFGTWLYQKTRDPKIVQRLMRHAKFTTAMKYVHDERPLVSVVNQLPALTGASLKVV